MTDSEICRAILEAALAEPVRLDAAARQTLGAAAEPVLQAALRDFAAAHGAAALPVLTTLAGDEAARGVRRAAKRALYRLSQQGVAAPAKPPRRLVVERRPERAVRAWLSGIDGTGSRAVWVLFEGGYGSAALCSLIVNDTAGILDVAGGDITKKRLEEELKSLRASQKLPWVEVDPARAVRAVAEALALHATLATSPPAAFDRWKPTFENASGGVGALAGVGGHVGAPHVQHAGHAANRANDPDPPLVDRLLVDRAAELLALPELASWFIDPESVQSDALALLEARESRLVVSDQIKAEREAAIIDGVIEVHFPAAARLRWAGRLREMADIFGMTGRADEATLAHTVATALADADRPAATIPFVRALAARGLEMAAEVALGRARLDDVSRAPSRRTRS